MRWVIRGISALLFTAAALLGLLLLLPGEKIAGLAADQVEKQTGRKLTISGPVQFSLWPTVGIKADGVWFQNAGWAGPEPMFQAERLNIGLDAADLLSGTVNITELTAILPVLNLAVDADGRGNWEFSQAQTSAATSDPETTTLLSVARMGLRGATLRYAPHGEAPIELTQVDLDLNWPNPDAAADFDISLRPAGAPVRLTGNVEDMIAFMNGATTRSRVAAKLPGGTALFEGAVATNGQVQGQLTLNSDNTSDAFQAVGLGVVELPNGMGQRVDLATAMTYDGVGKLTFDDLIADLDGNRFTGEATVDLTPERPNVVARLTADALNLSEALSSDETTPASVPQTGWSTDRIDASALSLADGEVSFTFNSLRAGDLRFGPSQLQLSLERSRAVLKLQPAAMFDGQVRGQMVVNNRSGLSIGGNLNFEGVRLEQLLGQTAGFDKLNGEAVGQLRYLASGNSIDALMKSMSGKGRLDVGKGFFTGFDLEALMKPGGGNGGSTVFDAMKGTFAMEAGVLDNQDLLMQVKGISVEGAGQVLLGEQALDYLFTPKVERGDQLISIPVKVTGPWADPKIRPDLSRAVAPKLEEVKEDAKQKLRDTISEKLEVDVTPDQNVNEILKDRIEKEAKDQLLKFLSGN
ncbi:AsmA family protein [Epibacterium ulvae]|uniref:AsmA family protein n=1 Tax=Epibacterium ulvae TaxID=1156985 RepID=UPI0024903E3B|nr:AsmA family protein [Epibacterium ulvae]